MNIEKELLEDRQAKLTVTYSTEEFEGFKRRAAKKISKNAKIPGFRPGKAPYQVVVNHYGEGAILQEAIDILLDDDYTKMLDEVEIEPSGPGNLETIESYDPPTLVFKVPLEPEIDLGEYREIRKEYALEAFDEMQVDEFIDNIRRNSATIVPAERAAKEGDLVYFNLSGEFLNPQEGEDASITDKTPQQVVIPEKGENSKDEWPFPGFAKKLKGVKAGDVKEIQKTYPKSFEDEDFQGKTALFTVDVQSVKELELPDFNEDFVQTLGNYESPEDFRTKIEEHLREEHKNSYENNYFDELLNVITKNAKMTYPPQMLEHEEEHVLEDIKSRLDHQNMDFETYLKLRNMEEKAFIEKEVRPAAKERLERTLIVDKLIETEGLKLNQELLKTSINEVMTEVIYSGNLEEMQKQMGKDEFSRAISMEGVQRTMNSQLQERLKLIATGQPIPEDDAEPTEGEIADEVELDEIEAVVTETEAELESPDEITEKDDAQDEAEPIEDEPESAELVDSEKDES